MFTDIKEMPEVKICKLEIHDIPECLNIARQWVISDGNVVEEEILDIGGRMLKSVGLPYANKECYEYFVAKDGDGKIIGMVGTRFPEEQLKQYIDMSKVPLELINFFIDREQRGKGVGKMLFDQVVERARSVPEFSIVWSSGKRYQDSSWGFYQHIAGDPVATVEGFFGPNSVAKIWQYHV